MISSLPSFRTEPSTIHTKSAAAEAVKGTVAELIQVLDDARLNELDQAEQRRHEIKRMVMRRASYEEMAKRALGIPWSEINEQKRQEFVGLFIQQLRNTFAGRINEHTDEQVVYLGEQREDYFAEVKTQLKDQKVDTRVDFCLMHASRDWLVYDVVIDGTSIIRSMICVGLVKKMKPNTAAAKFFEKTPPATHSGGNHDRVSGTSQNLR